MKSRIPEGLPRPSVLLLACAMSVIPAVAPSAASPTAWLDGVSEEIRRSEYHFSRVADGSWSAPSRAQGLRSFFSPEGEWRLVPRREGDGSWELRLALAGVGRGADLDAPGPAVVSARAERLEISRDLLTEWYVNEPRGVEQGFTIPRRIGGPEEPDLPLVLEMEIGGTVTGALTAAGDIAFRSPSYGEVVRYAGLVVRDATGATLPSRFEMKGSARLRIVVEDVGASYPVVVDPLATGADWTGDSDQLNAEYGFSVSTAGDVNDDGYGDVIVGADEYDNGETSEGRVFVFYGSSSGLPTSPSWIAESNLLDADFGVSVASAGDVNGDGYDDIIVGANQLQHDVCFANANVECTSSAQCVGVCVEQGTSTACGTQPCVCDNDPTVSCSTDLECDFDLCRTPDEGAAFVFHGSPTGLDAEGARPEGSWDNADWAVEGNQSGANFGVNVAPAGDVNGDGFDDVIVGADEWNNGHTDEGAAFVYLGSAVGLSTTAVWSDESNLVDTDYGFAVGPAGDINGDGYDDIVVGAWNWDNVKLDEGRVFLYLGSPSGPVSPAHWVAEAAADDSHFGKSVWTAGDVNGDGYDDVMIGADEWNDPLIDEGGVFVWHGSAAGLPRYCSVTAEQVCEVDSDCPGGEFCRLDTPLDADWNATSGEIESDFGYVAKLAGDVNADGYDDVIVGAPDWDDAGVCNSDDKIPCNDDEDCPIGDFCDLGDEGAAFLYTGSGGGLSSRPVWIADVDQTAAQFGRAVSGAGDVNGDGFDDVIVGADEYDSGTTDEGSAFVYLSCAVSPALHSPDLHVDHAGGDRNVARLTWSALPGSVTDRYDVVKGALGPLRANGGNFEVATEECVASNLAATQADYTGTPAVGEFWWFLVRGSVSCGSGGTYDTAARSQVIVRDPWIGASANSCN